MDLPEAIINRDRGLPSEQDRPSVRLLRPSDPNRDPEHRGSLVAPVASKIESGVPLLASPGIATPQEGDWPPDPPQSALD